MHDHLRLCRDVIFAAVMSCRLSTKENTHYSIFFADISC